MRLLKYVLISFFLFFYQLGFSQDCYRIDTIFLFESTAFEKELKKGEILSKIVDTIETKNIYTEFAWRIEEFIDTINRQINIQLLLDQTYFCYDYDIKLRNIYFIELSKYDSIFIDRIFINNIDTLDKSIFEFIKNPTDDLNLPEKRVEFINYFGKVCITKHAFMIYSVMIADSNGVSSSWAKLNPLINKILNCYLILRNELAIETWGVVYEELDFEKKASISKYYPINIWIFPNFKLIEPPPPPPYEQTEQYKIDSMVNSYFKELIKYGLFEKK
jgi:hypothetical protein